MWGEAERRGEKAVQQSYLRNQCVNYLQINMETVFFQKSCKAKKKKKLLLSFYFFYRTGDYM